MLEQQVGRYRVTGKLGQGGMGEIFSAYDEKLKRTVAMKVIAGGQLDADAQRDFLREARAAAALDHPFICTVHEVLEHDGQPVIVMECVEGETLADRLARETLDIREVCRYGVEIAEALAAAHARGVVHRDIKSGNIMVTAAGHVKVMDFGLALIATASPTDETERIADAAGVAGTLPYIAPELLRGERAGAAADLFAFGVVLYEMATRRRPFSGATAALVMSEILERRPAPARQLNSAVPPALDELIASLLDKQPSRRPAATEIMASLREIAAPAREKPRRALAVLPFRALTGDPDSAHLGVGLADAITSELALVRPLLVRPTTTILAFEGHDPIEAGRELGVDAVSPARSSAPARGCASACSSSTSRRSGRCGRRRSTPRSKMSSPCRTRFRAKSSTRCSSSSRRTTRGNSAGARSRPATCSSCG